MHGKKGGDGDQNPFEFLVSFTKLPNLPKMQQTSIRPRSSDQRLLFDKTDRRFLISQWMRRELQKLDRNSRHKGVTIQRWWWVVWVFDFLRGYLQNSCRDRLVRDHQIFPKRAFFETLSSRPKLQSSRPRPRPENDVINILFSIFLKFFRGLKFAQKSVLW